ncbi:hypothetical protein ACWDUN_01030 [Mycobacterium sp. NPDC003323]
MNRDFVEELRRWEDTGAHWEVVDRRPDRLTIALLRCDGGEEVDRFTSTDPALLAFVGSRDRSA